MKKERLKVPVAKAHMELVLSSAEAFIKQLEKRRGRRWPEHTRRLAAMKRALKLVERETVRAAKKANRTRPVKKSYPAAYKKVA